MDAAPPAPHDIVDVLYAIDPQAWERAKRVKMAMDMLRKGVLRVDVQRFIRVRFAISRAQAWRVVDMANDMAGEP